MSNVFPLPHPHPAFELKGNLLTLLVFRVLDASHEKLAVQLDKKFKQAAALLQHAPVVIDLQVVHEKPVDLGYIVGLLRSYGLIPVGVRGGTVQQNEIAMSLSLGILPELKVERTRRESVGESPVATPIAAKIVTQPVRSGQQIVELQGDLIILATVSPGAEILAKRHIHVYGALRGRALAGVTGDVEARIFCQAMEAELVSIAGNYVVNEDLKASLRGKPAQVYLQQAKLVVQALT
jgi:septum site-determining protein MinC